MTRAPALQTLIDRLAGALAAADLTVPARQSMDRCFARLETPAATARPKTDALPLIALFDQTLAPLRQRADALAPLAGALAALGPDLPWTTRKAVGPTASPGFATAHANAYMIGPGGIEQRDDVMLGLSLMAPHTRYPDHDHAPEEVYLVLSPGAFLQGDAPWIERQAGQTVHNTSGIRHAMRSYDQPFLALWCLPA